MRNNTSESWYAVYIGLIKTYCYGRDANPEKDCTLTNGKEEINNHVIIFQNIYKVGIVFLFSKSDRMHMVGKELCLGVCGLCLNVYLLCNAAVLKKSTYYALKMFYCVHE